MIAAQPLVPVSLTVPSLDVIRGARNDVCSSHFILTEYRDTVRIFTGLDSIIHHH